MWLIIIPAVTVHNSDFTVLIERNIKPVHTVYISSSSLAFSPKTGYGRSQSSVRRPVWLWHTAF